MDSMTKRVSVGRTITYATAAKRRRQFPQSSPPKPINEEDTLSLAEMSKRMRKRTRSQGDSQNVPNNTDHVPSSNKRPKLQRTDPRRSNVLTSVDWTQQPLLQNLQLTPRAHTRPAFVIPIDPPDDVEMASEPLADRYSPRKQPANKGAMLTASRKQKENAIVPSLLGSPFNDSTSIRGPSPSKKPPRNATNFSRHKSSDHSSLQSFSKMRRRPSDSRLLNPKKPDQSWLIASHPATEINRLPRTPQPLDIDIDFDHTPNSFFDSAPVGFSTPVQRGPTIDEEEDRPFTPRKLDPEPSDSAPVTLTAESMSFTLPLSDDASTPRPSPQTGHRHVRLSADSIFSSSLVLSVSPTTRAPVTHTPPESSIAPPVFRSTPQKSQLISPSAVTEGDELGDLFSSMGLDEDGMRKCGPTPTSSPTSSQVTSAPATERRVSFDDNVTAIIDPGNSRTRFRIGPKGALKNHDLPDPRPTIRMRIDPDPIPSNDEFDELLLSREHYFHT
ncbi:hypothetical protein SISSUDRAFT_1058011 [Sistotremastrum suecicum HHB10207 ss-3]|uniref:Uncharacterized protein n=1 Tax=Sistotremastrum suecicum HHB10207 ss-3 TaxID=1314776 RepID=A0A166HZW1_9AGAM|nr:hypothetical protein SISSUDRAFT_1058011 [Sistotremastrum suecicum HHB10207 ss-3]